MGMPKTADMRGVFAPLLAERVLPNNYEDRVGVLTSKSEALVLYLLPAGACILSSCLV